MWHCNWGYPFGHGGWFMGHGLLGTVLGILLFLVILSLAVSVIRSLIPKNRQNRDNSDSLAIFRMRFARGEMSEEEYRRIRALLDS
jgi:putative membrane protein